MTGDAGPVAAAEGLGGPGGQQEAGAGGSEAPGGAEGGVLRVEVPWLRGPVHSWLAVPEWVHEQMHAEGVEHRHHPEDGR